MSEFSPSSVANFLEWFKKTPFAKFYEDEILGIENIYMLLDEVTVACPTAAEVCSNIRNRYNEAFYKELKADHKKWVNENSPGTKRLQDASGSS